LANISKFGLLPKQIFVHNFPDRLYSKNISAGGRNFKIFNLPKLHFGNLLKIN